MNIGADGGGTLCLSEIDEEINISDGLNRSALRLSVGSNRIYLEYGGMRLELEAGVIQNLNNGKAWTYEKPIPYANLKK